jgi:hypothetical protein
VNFCGAQFKSVPQQLRLCHIPLHAADFHLPFPPFPALHPFTPRLLIVRKKLMQGLTNTVKLSGNAEKMKPPIEAFNSIPWQNHSPLIFQY